MAGGVYYRSMEDTTVMQHLNAKSDIRIEPNFTDSRPAGYPVIYIGSVIIFPSMTQVETLRDALTAYLEERTAAEMKAAQDATDAAFAKLGVE